MKKYLTIILLLTYSPLVLADNTKTESDEPRQEEEFNPSILHQVLLYLPNRVFDFLDIFRIKARLGPGFDVGLQITEPVRLYAGGHSAVFIGIPGPRTERTIPIPIGAEAKAGGALSVLDGITEKNTGSKKTYSEINAELQLILIGLDIGIDPLEIADFFTGFICMEVVEDDV